MWCGDLVSPRTWGHLWLNEAFATLMPYLCLAEIAPEYVGENDLARFEVQEAIEFDFSRYTHPIAADPNDPHAIFDSVSYSKGAAVLGMLAQGLGERPFQYGMRMYFEEYNLGTSTTDEFLESFDRSIGEDISEFIRPWITQAGFPTIQVSRSGVGYHLRQTRLCRDGAEEETLWPIPVSLSTGGVMMMDRKEMDIRSDDLITINDGRLAMAIIEYEQELLGEIIQNWKEIEPEARWVLLDDLWELMLAKRVSPRFLWDALNCLRYETSLEVVETGILRGIQFYQIYSRVNRSLSDIFRPYVIMDPPQSLFASRFRVKLLSALIRMEDQETLESVRRISIDEAPEDLLPLVMQLRGRTDFAFAKAEYAKAQTPQRRNAALAAIGATETHLSEAFAMILKDIKTHEIPTLLAALGANRRARGLIVEWFKTNADKLFDIFTAGSQMQSIITIVYGACDSASEVEGLSNFFTGDRWSPLVATIGRASEYESARMHLKTIPWDTQ
jgi:aminopeptidase N